MSEFPMTESHCSFSTGIDGSITAGRGRLDDNGYWEFPCDECATRANYRINEQRKRDAELANLRTSLTAAQEAEQRARAERDELREQLKAREAGIQKRDEEIFEARTGWARLEADVFNILHPALDYPDDVTVVEMARILAETIGAYDEALAVGEREALAGAIKRAETAESQLSTARADLATAEQENNRLRAQDGDGCPCLHTTPCMDNCTCVSPISSAGCLLCCRYGSDEQQRNQAEYLATSEQAREALQARIEKAKTLLRHSRAAIQTCSTNEALEFGVPLTLGNDIDRFLTDA